mgnify:CR=1 FL=1
MHVPMSVFLENWDKMSKQDVARKLMDRFAALYNTRA